VVLHWTSRFRRRIIREPPFGSDGIPKLYEWQAVLARHPPGVRPIVWEAAIYDAALLFGLDKLRAKRKIEGGKIDLNSSFLFKDTIDR
jgi:hypothetical protein